MSSKPFTEGPWAICDEPQNELWFKGTTIYSKTEGKRVADSCHLNSSWEANAHLIAAAPDLLEALRAVVAVADRKTVEFDLAHAAIAKAEGRS